MVKVYIKLVCVLCIGALWRTTANMAFCYLFWITTLAWVVRYIIRAKVKGGLFVLLGITCNALVTSLNKGVMPSVGIPANFQPAAPIWNVSGQGQWLTLADQAAFYRFSIGDMFLIAGFLMFLLDTVYRLPMINPIKEWWDTVRVPFRSQPKVRVLDARHPSPENCQPAPLAKRTEGVV